MAEVNPSDTAAGGGLPRLRAQPASTRILASLFVLAVLAAASASFHGLLLLVCLSILHACWLQDLG